MQAAGVCVGDRILGINGIDVVNATHRAVVNLIRRAGNHVELILTADESFNAVPETPKPAQELKSNKLQRRRSSVMSSPLVTNLRKQLFDIVYHRQASVSRLNGAWSIDALSALDDDDGHTDEAVVRWLRGSSTNAQLQEASFHITATQVILETGSSVIATFPSAQLAWCAPWYVRRDDLLAVKLLPDALCCFLTDE